MINSERQKPINRTIVSYRTAAGFVISGFFLWLTFRNTDFHSFKIIPNPQSLLLLLAAMVVLIISVWLQSLRMKFFWLSENRKWSNIHTFESLLIGNFYNSIVPGNLGEGVKAWHLSRKNNVPFIRAIAALLAEKWIDAHLFLFFGILFFLFQPFRPHFIYYSILTVMGVISALLILNTVMQKFRWVEKKIWGIAFLYKKIGLPLFKIYVHVGWFLKHLSKSWRIVFYWLAAMSAFAFNMLQYYLLFKAVGIPLSVGGLATAYLISVGMVVIIAIPAAPGNIGVLHYGVYSILIFAANNSGIVPDNTLLQTFALYTVYLHFSCVIPEILLGSIFVVKERKVIF